MKPLTISPAWGGTSKKSSSTKQSRVEETEWCTHEEAETEIVSF